VALPSAVSGPPPVRPLDYGMEEANCDMFLGPRGQRRLDMGQGVSPPLVRAVKRRTARAGLADHRLPARHRVPGHSDRDGVGGGVGCRRALHLRRTRRGAGAGAGGPVRCPGDGVRQQVGHQPEDGGSDRASRRRGWGRRGRTRAVRPGRDRCPGQRCAGRRVQRRPGRAERDEALSVCRLIEDLDGAVVVMVPQDVAPAEVRRSVGFCRALRLPVLEITGNISRSVWPGCGRASSIFGAGGGQRVARSPGVPFLDCIAIDPTIGESCGPGTAMMHRFVRRETAQAFGRVVSCPSFSFPQGCAARVLGRLTLPTHRRP
jgi:hypothetical protein